MTELAYISTETSGLRVVGDVFDLQDLDGDGQTDFVLPDGCLALSSLPFGLSLRAPPRSSALSA